MMALINNWDLKDSNNVIIKVRGDNGDELRYTISDLAPRLDTRARLRSSGA